MFARDSWRFSILVSRKLFTRKLWSRNFVLMPFSIQEQAMNVRSRFGGGVMACLFAAVVFRFNVFGWVPRLSYFYLRRGR